MGSSDSLRDQAAALAELLAIEGGGPELISTPPSDSTPRTSGNPSGRGPIGRAS